MDYKERWDGYVRRTIISAICNKHIQPSEINKLDDTAYNYTKADESAPYAPHRIQKEAGVMRKPNMVDVIIAEIIAIVLVLIVKIAAM